MLDFSALIQAQADQRASLLREELNNRRKVLQQRLDNERDERERQVPKAHALHSFINFFMNFFSVFSKRGWKYF